MMSKTRNLIEWIVFFAQVVFTIGALFIMSSAVPQTGKGFLIADRFLIPFWCKANNAEAYSNFSSFVFIIGGAMFNMWILLQLVLRKKRKESISLKPK